MIVRIKLALDQLEYSALAKMAMGELRPIPDQARYILRSELERRGLLEATPVLIPSDPDPLDVQPQGVQGDK